MPNQPSPCVPPAHPSPLPPSPPSPLPPSPSPPSGVTRTTDGAITIFHLPFTEGPARVVSPPKLPPPPPPPPPQLPAPSSRPHSSTHPRILLGVSSCVSGGTSSLVVSVVDERDVRPSAQVKARAREHARAPSSARRPHCAPSRTIKANFGGGGKSGSKRLVCRIRAAGRFSAPRGETLLLLPPRHS